jgi:hypothetical protein
MASVWTYSDWITYDQDSANRLTRLRLHIQEVSDFISTGNYSKGGRNIDKGDLQKYLDSLLDKEKEETSISGGATGKTAAFTRGKPLF